MVTIFGTLCSDAAARAAYRRWVATNAGYLALLVASAAAGSIYGCNGRPLAVGFTLGCHWCCLGAGVLVAFNGHPAVLQLAAHVMLACA